jgi:hypothetical protein
MLCCVTGAGGLREARRVDSAVRACAVSAHGRTQSSRIREILVCSRDRTSPVAIREDLLDRKVDRHRT